MASTLYNTDDADIKMYLAVIAPSTFGLAEQLPNYTKEQLCDFVKVGCGVLRHSKITVQTREELVHIIEQSI